MKTEYIWEIKVKNTPTLKRKCNHCNSKQFYCSNKFRMNAQKRNIDVWLIYRCTACDSTYNLTILSRSKPEMIKKELFHQFSENSEAAAWEYAFSLETARRNNVEVDYSNVEYEIRHDPVSVDDLLCSGHECIAFKIHTRFEFGLKLSAVIRTCLGLSASRLEQLVEAKAIFTSGNCPLKKHKVRNGDLVWVDREKLREAMANMR